jgi:hypothetical protein
MDDPIQSNPRGDAKEDSSGTPANSANNFAMFAVAERAREQHRRAILRRLEALLAAAGAAFILTTWLLVRMDIAGKSAAGNSNASQVVRRQLEALDRGELREAYALFSQHYRQQVPFEAFHELVASHWRMFRARKIEFVNREESRVRAVLDTHITASDGGHYLARYTLVEIEGQWWIDDLRWGIEGEARGRITA